MAGDSFPSLINEILQVSDIREVISQYVSLKKAGKNYKGLCPFHKEAKPSLNVSAEKGLWHCFGCGSGGNIFHFLMKIENMTFIEAAKYLAQKYNIPWKVEYDKEKSTKREILYKIHDIANRYYQHNLYNNKDALDYLIHKRKLTHATLTKFRLGYATSNNDLYQFLKKEGFNETEIEEAGLIIKKEDGIYYDRFRDRIIFPIFDIMGNVIAFSARALKEEDEPKYLNSPDTLIFQKGKILFGLNFAKQPITQKDEAVIVEGNLDVITAHQNNIDNVICSMGTALTDSQCFLLLRFTKNVIIAYDSDKAGCNATKRAIEILINKEFNIKVANMPQDTDPDKLLKEKGQGYFINILNNAIRPIDFYLNLILQDKPLDAISKTKAIEQLIPLFDKIKNPIVKDEYIKITSARLNIEEDTLKSFKIFKEKKVEQEEKLPLLGEDRIEKELLKLMLNDNTVLKKVKENLKCDDFKSYPHIVELIYQYDDLQEIINRLEDSDQRRIITEIILDKDIPFYNEQVIMDYINRIKSLRLKDEIKILQDKIKFYEEKEDYDKLKELMKSCVEYETKLRRIGGEI